MGSRNKEENEGKGRKTDLWRNTTTAWKESLLDQQMSQSIAERVTAPQGLLAKTLENKTPWDKWESPFGDELADAELGNPALSALSLSPA